LPSKRSNKNKNFYVYKENAKANETKPKGTMTLSIMTFSIMTFSIMTFSIKSLFVTFCIKGLYVKIGISDTQRKRHSA